MKKNFLIITGGAGFIGTNLIKKLALETNFNIISIDNNSYELTVDNKVSISEIINSFNNNKINVIEILSKRNKLEELFMELTQE